MGQQRPIEDIDWGGRFYPGSGHFVAAQQVTLGAEADSHAAAKSGRFNRGKSAIVRQHADDQRSLPINLDSCDYVAESQIEVL
jgi:hypothetical protein